MELKILVTGATGTMGQELMRLLRNSGVDFTAASRSLSRLPAGIRGMQLNYDSIPLLEQALRGIDVLFLLQPLSRELIPQAENILRAARSAGVQFVLRVSQFGASAMSRYLFQRVHGEADELLQESGLRYCILRPNIFMQNFTHPLGEYVRQGTLYLPQGEGRTSYFDARDAAGVALKILVDPWRYHKSIFELTGERAISNAEAISLISHQVGRRLAYVPITEETALKSLEKVEEDPWKREIVMSTHRATKEGQLSDVTTTYKDLLGRMPHRFEDFCREMREAWIRPEAEPPIETSP